MQPSNYPPNIDYLDTGIDDPIPLDDDISVGDQVVNINTGDRYMVWNAVVDGDQLVLELVHETSQSHLFRAVDHMDDFKKI